MIRRIALTCSHVSRPALLAAALACAPALPIGAPLAHAQQAAPDDDVGDPAGTISRPVVQSTTPSPTRALNNALSSLARDPRDMSALVDAGSAALDLGDTDAAIGFFTRAEQVAPGNGGVRARIGVAMLRSNQPFEAIRWFDQADQAGFPRAEMATDRGLAYDLIGDNAAAQRQYQMAIAGGPNEEASRRYAISLVIAGDRRGAEQVIQPLLERRDRGAWRVRTFIMAIAGQSDEAVGIANATMPADLAASIAPYLRYMPRLTAAQQASAANMGRFPRAADIGRDDPQIVQYAALHPRAPRVDAGLIPAGAALGGKGRDDRDSRAKRRRPGKDTVVASAQPAQTVPAQTVPTPPAVSAPWGLQPSVQAQSKPQQIAAAPMQVPPAPVSPRPASAPVVLSKLDVPPGTPLASAPLPSPKPGPAGLAAGRPSPVQVSTPVVQPITTPAPAPAPVSPKPAPALAQASTQPTPPVSAPVSAPVSPPIPAPVLQPVPSGAAVSGPALALLTTPAPAPQPAPAVQAAPPLAQTAAGPADFRSMFDGFKPPEQEATPPEAAVDLAEVEALRKAAQKTARDKAKDKDKAKDRGDRPDGPTAVSRSSAEEPLTTGSKAAKDKLAKDKAKADADKTAKEKATLDKACADIAAGKGKSGKGSSAKGKAGKVQVGKGKSAKDPVCPAETDKKGKNGKNQPTHASRIWVQVLTGANRGLMGREWERLAHQASALRGRKPSITPWRNNFRLLTGPFDSDAEAQAFLGKLRGDGVSGFEWTSPAGQAVDSLALK